jgi:hypothetical protein
LERISYTKQRVLSGAPFLLLLLVILLKCTYGTVELSLMRSSSTMVQKLMALNLFAFLPTICSFLFCIFLIYHHSEYRESGIDRLSRIGFLLVLGAEVLGGLSDFLISLVQMIFLPQMMKNIELNLLFGDINGWQIGVARLVFLAGFVLLVAGPVYRKLAGKGHLAVAILLSAVAFGIEIFLYTQVDPFTLYIIGDVTSLLRHTYLLIFLKHGLRKLETTGSV